jgi:serine/threonine protein kinase
MDNMAGKDLGRYHVIEPLGKGGMASVYKAFDSTLERNVAIKIIRSDAIVGDEQAQFLVRFQREARALAQLDHPYILKSWIMANRREYPTWSCLLSRGEH